MASDQDSDREDTPPIVPTDKTVRHTLIVVCVMQGNYMYSVIVI